MITFWNGNEVNSQKTYDSVSRRFKMELRNMLNSVLPLIICLLGTTLIFSCAGRSDAQMEAEKLMRITLKVLNIVAEEPFSVELEFTLTNDTTKKFEVLKWGTPFEGEFNENMFDVTKDGEPVPYLGRQFKRGAPQKEDFIELAPQSELTATLFLEKAYAIADPGLYTVQYRKPYISIKLNQSEMQIVPVVSNRIEFNIEE
jgi:hypothetical protein